MGNILSARYQVYQDVKGNFRFRLRAANNKIVVVSQGYETKSNCLIGIASIQKNCQSKIEDKTIGDQLANPKYEIFVDSDLKFRFNLLAQNGQVIGSSEAYNSKQGCKNGIEAVKNSCDSVIEDLTTNQVIEQKTKETEIQCESIEITGIAMMSPPNVVGTGSIITFEGWLINNKTGQGIENAKIDILEHDRSFLGDKILVSGVTKQGGIFAIDWKSHPADWWDDSVEIFSQFSGKDKCKPSRSAYYKIRVV